MKILHTADWHLGHYFYGYDRSQEHKHFLTWLLGVVRSQKPDAFLLAGDIFDNPNPSNISENLFEDFLAQLTKENPSLRVIITTGNHDSASHLEARSSIYRRIGIQIRTQIEIKENGDINWDDLCIPITSIENPSDKIVVAAIPYLYSDILGNNNAPGEGIQLFCKKLIQSATKRFPNVPIVTMAHIFARNSKVCTDTGIEREITEGPNLVDISAISKNVSYFALGHLHKAQQVSNHKHAWYTGSALPMSFSEKDFWHGVNIVEFDTENAISIHREEYKPLRNLITIPSQGNANSNEILQLLSVFEKCEKNDNPDKYPYLEIKISEENPNPDTLIKITREISHRKVKLCRIERVYFKSPQTDDDRLNTIDLQNIVPAKIARNIFMDTYGEELTDEMAAIIAEVKRTCDNIPTKSQNSLKI